MDDAERLEGIYAALDRLEGMLPTHVVLVEGIKDAEALRRAGIDGDFYLVQSGGGPVRAAEHAWRAGRPAVVMTDWDRRGGSLAEALRENLSSLGVRYDDTVRRDLAIFCRPYAKDVESLDSVIGLLEARTGAGP